MIKLRHVSVFPLALKQNKQTNKQVDFCENTLYKSQRMDITNLGKKYPFFFKSLAIVKVEQVIMEEIILNRYPGKGEKVFLYHLP